MKHMFLALVTISAVSSFGLGSAPALAASPAQVEDCLEQYGSYVPGAQVSAMSATCRSLASPPPSRFPRGHWPMDSAEVTAFATTCAMKFGAVVSTARQEMVEETCRLFYYPVYGKRLLSIQVPKHETETAISN